MPQYTLGFSDSAWAKLTVAEQQAIREKVHQFQALLTRIEKHVRLRPSPGAKPSPNEELWEMLNEMLRRGPRL